MSEIIVDLDEARRDLAAVFRWTARESMHEGIANHFSYAVSDDGQQFLMNPFGVHFSRMKASDLLLLDARKTPDVIKAIFLGHVSTKSRMFYSCPKVKPYLLRGVLI